MEIKEILEDARLLKPLIHHITNYVTCNDCANVTLAIGGRPVMADEIIEVSEMVSISNSLVLNIGTLCEKKLSSMIIAGKTANKLNIPIVLDPVGAASTSFRKKAVEKLLKDLKISVIKGNLSEIKTLNGIISKGSGVDSLEEAPSVHSLKAIALELSLKTGAIVAITGEKDIISNGEKTYCIENGNYMLSNVTGTGCMCSSIIGVFCGTASLKNNDDYLTATTSAILTMGIAGEIALENISGIENHGTGSFKIKLMDAIFNINYNDIVKRGKYYEI